MSSEVDICNLALSHLGDEAQVIAITPPDGTMQAALCGRFYPLARNVLLELYAWPFATKRVAVAQVDNPSPDDWQYAYALPSTCIRPLAALYPGVAAQSLSNDAPDLGSFPYIVETGQDGKAILYTNVQATVLRYIDLVTDTQRFTPGFTVSLSRLLAAYLSGPILKGATGMKVAQDQLKWFDLEYRRAAAASANTGKRDAYAQRLPSFVAARGGLSQDPLPSA